MQWPTRHRKSTTHPRNACTLEVLFLSDIVMPSTPPLLNMTFWLLGSFSFIADIPADRIAMFEYTTQQWYPLGSGVKTTGGGGARVNALASSGAASGAVYVGGLFDKAGDATVSNVAMWAKDPATTNVPIDEPVEVQVWGSESQQMCGERSGLIILLFLLQWYWVALGTGLPSEVFGLAYAGNRLWAVGAFGLSVWDSTAWANVGAWHFLLLLSVPLTTIYALMPHA